VDDPARVPCPQSHLYGRPASTRPMASGESNLRVGLVGSVERTRAFALRAGLWGWVRLGPRNQGLHNADPGRWVVWHAVLEELPMKLCVGQGWKAYTPLPIFFHRVRTFKLHGTISDQASSIPETIPRYRHGWHATRLQKSKALFLAMIESSLAYSDAVSPGSGIDLRQRGVRWLWQ
jgi:hypothetical protein